MKQTEIKTLEVNELQEKLETFQKKYTDLKMAHKINRLENPIQIKGIRRTIARLKTELTKRALTNGN